MKDGNGIRGVMVPSRIVRCVVRHWNTWRDDAITFCDVGDMAMDTRHIDMCKLQAI
jgi:hypothetical protein